jgi:hypothetical protein
MSFPLGSVDHTLTCELASMDFKYSQMQIELAKSTRTLRMTRPRGVLKKLTQSSQPQKLQNLTAVLIWTLRHFLSYVMKYCKASMMHCRKMKGGAG